MNRSPKTTALNLRAGEWVEVLSAPEILATLDDKHELDGLPFMPEMLKYCGGSSVQGGAQDLRHH